MKTLRAASLVSVQLGIEDAMQFLRSNPSSKNLNELITKGKGLEIAACKIIR